METNQLPFGKNLSIKEVFSKNNTGSAFIFWERSPNPFIDEDLLMAHNNQVAHKTSHFPNSLVYAPDQKEIFSNFEQNKPIYSKELSEFIRVLSNNGIKLLVCPSKGTDPKNVPHLQIIKQVQDQLKNNEIEISNCKGRPLALRYYQLRQLSANIVKNSSPNLIKGPSGSYIVNTSTGSALVSVQAKIEETFQGEPNPLFSIRLYSKNSSRLNHLLEKDNEKHNDLFEFTATDPVVWNEILKSISSSGNKLVFEIGIAGAQGSEIWKTIELVLSDYLKNYTIVHFVTRVLIF